MTTTTTRVEPLDPTSEAGRQAAAELVDVLADLRVAVAEREHRKTADEQAA